MAAAVVEVAAITVAEQQQGERPINRDLPSHHLRIIAIAKVVSYCCAALAS